MSTIANELLTLNNTKLAIKEAIINKGVDVGEEDTFASYADKIDEIETGGGGGSAIDTSKVDYQIGAGYIGLYGGRLLKGFAAMDSKCAFPIVGLNNADMGVPWNDSFEIGARFKFTAFPTYQSIFGDGNYGSYRKSPRILYSNNEGKLWLCISSNGSTLAIDEPLDYTIALDTWYFVKLKFVKSTMRITVDITEDFETYVNLYDDTMSATPYYDSSAYLSIGGEARSADMASNTFLIDTFNTYVKDATGSIVWGCFEGQGAEYELWDYIESDGTQYIDTGIKVIQGHTIETIFHPLSNQPSYAWLFGAGDTTHYYGFQFPQQTTLLVYNGSTSSSGQMSVNTADEYVYSLTFTTSNFLDMNYYIFGFHYSEDPSGGVNLGKFRLYSFSIDNNFYLPCKRKSDGVFGLWDVTNQTFLGDSAGGNAFTGGNKISDIHGGSPAEEIIFNAENIKICTSESYYLSQQPLNVNITEAGTYIVSLHRTSDDKVWTSAITYDGISDTTFSISYERGFTLHLTPTTVGCQYYEGNWTDIYIKLSKALDSQIYII